MPVSLDFLQAPVRAGDHAGRLGRPDGGLGRPALGQGLGHHVEMTIGPVALVTAVALTGLAALMPAAHLARRLQLAGAIALTTATAGLALAFVTEDWRFASVVDNTRGGVGPLLRFSGLWAGPEGSLLLWTTMVGWVAVIAGRVAPQPDRHRAVRLGAALTFAYGLLTAVTAWPFERIPAPAIDGIGLQPVLEYPAMVWHPPLLYGGLTGMLAPSLVALAAMIGRRPPLLSAPMLLVPLSLLTAGLVTGAMWAGVELGWGGYWAWDPIESAGLVAWVCGAAALHATARSSSERSTDSPSVASTATPSIEPSADSSVDSGVAQVVVPSVIGHGGTAAAVFLAPGLAALWATTLTRIGVVASVHAFADRPALRVGLLSVAAGASAVTVAAVAAAAGGRSANRTATTGATTLAGRGPTGRRAAIALLVAAAVLIALGTYEPLVEAGLSGDALSIAGHYYSRLLWPLCVLGGVLAVRADRAWWPAAAGSAIGLTLVPIAAGPFALMLGAAGGVMAGSAIATGFAGRRGAIAHLGVGMVLVGVAGTVATTVTATSVAVDRPIEVAGMTLTHRDIELVEGTTTSEAVATVDVDGRTLHPRLVTYPLRGTSTVEVARRVSGFDEVQVLLLDGDATTARYQVHRLPRVGLVWLGSAVLAVGLAAGALGGRRRSGPPDRAQGRPSERPQGVAPDPNPAEPLDRR